MTGIEAIAGESMAEWLQQKGDEQAKCITKKIMTSSFDIKPPQGTGHGLHAKSSDRHSYWLLSGLHEQRALPHLSKPKGKLG